MLERALDDAARVVALLEQADGLGRQMRFGVGTARRGWIGPEHVLNTRGVDEVRAFVARKRAHR